MLKLTKSSVFLFLSSLMSVSFIILITLSFLHLMVWYTQPRFVNISNENLTTTSAGFLIEFLIFLGISFVVLILGIIFLVLFFKARKKAVQAD